MAAKGTGTWLKVANKGGGTSTVFVSNKLGGRAFNQGETITQSELNTHLSQASKVLAKQGIDAAAKFPGTYKAASASASSGDAKIRQINDRLDGMANSVLEKYGQGGKGDRMSPLLTRENADKAMKNLESQIPTVQANIAKMSKREQAAARKEIRQTLSEVRPMAEKAFPELAKRATEKMNKSGQGGKGDRIESVLANASKSFAQRGIDASAYYKAKVSGQGGKGDRQPSRLPKAALSKAEKTQILLKNKARIKAEAGRKGDFEQVKRMNRVEKADRQRRKQENPNAPSFVRAAKAAEAKRKKKQGGG